MDLPMWGRLEVLEYWEPKWYPLVNDGWGLDDKYPDFLALRWNKCEACLHHLLEVPGDIEPQLFIVMTFSLMHPVLAVFYFLPHFSTSLVMLPMITIIMNIMDSNSCPRSDTGEPNLRLWAVHWLWRIRDQMKGSHVSGLGDRWIAEPASEYTLPFTA